MPCRVLIKSNSLTAIGQEQPISNMGLVIAVMPADHIWGQAEQAPTFISLTMECSMEEAATAFFETTDEEGTRKYRVDFDDLPNVGRTETIEVSNGVVGRTAKIRWSELRRAMRTSEGEMPVVPSMATDESQVARGQGNGAQYSTEMRAKKGLNSQTPGEGGRPPLANPGRVRGKGRDRG